MEGKKGYHRSYFARKKMRFTKYDDVYKRNADANMKDNIKGEGKDRFGDTDLVSSSFSIENKRFRNRFKLIELT